MVPSGGTPDDISAISEVVAAAQQGELEPGQFVIGPIVISSDGQWATAAVGPPANDPTRFQPDTALLHKIDRTWTIYREGTADIACGSGIPPDAAAQLGVNGNC